MSSIHHMCNVSQCISWFDFFPVSNQWSGMWKESHCYCCHFLNNSQGHSVLSLACAFACHGWRADLARSKCDLCIAWLSGTSPKLLWLRHVLRQPVQDRLNMIVRVIEDYLMFYTWQFLTTFPSISRYMVFWCFFQLCFNVSDIT